MSLKEYQEKRNFHKTSEPKGKAKLVNGSLRFVVQKHDASHLHYDFRLELDGVLKSWAVPKGPSLNPEHKRLAMMVEDHPLEYASFEGAIPAGNYGAGTVAIWDEGTYTPYEHKSREEDETELKRQLKAGHLTIILSGEKLKGEFALIKMKGRQENAWLLVKKNDAHATDRNIQLAADLIPNRKPDPMPHHVKPMLATLISGPFNQINWFFELKWDGYRAIAEVEKGQVKLYSRNNLDFASKYPLITASLAKLPGDVVMDGEIVVLDEKGIPQFQALQNFSKSGQGNLVYVIFDLLYLNGRDLQKQTLRERKAILERFLPALPFLSYCEHIEAKGIPFFAAAKKEGLEGIIAKEAKSTYQQGVRGMSWQKIKTHLSQEAIICGYTTPQGSRTNFGALILGVYDKNKLKYVGHSGSGFDEKMIVSVYAKMKALETNKCPFEVIPETNAPAMWLKPKLICEIEFAEWTDDGMMRQAIFKGMREDKDPSEITQEEMHATGFFGQKSPSEKEKDENKVQIGNRTISLTHLKKVFWPKEGYTKGDLIEYYRQVAPFILPHLKDRPQSLLRYPDGITGKSFFHKDVGDIVPNWMQIVDVRLETENKTIKYSLCQDEPSLIYLINLGCIDLNPWNSRVGHEDNPDYAIIDLDPEDTPFENVIKTTLAIRGLLEETGIVGYCKTSGARGVHIYIPLAARYTYEQARNFSLVLASLVNQKLPSITSLDRRPTKRQGKVYLDCFQNARGQTLASAYSVRPREGATVSTPLSWEEVTRDLSPEQFTIRNTFNRLEKMGDLFKPVLGTGIDMRKALKHLQQLDKT